MISKIRIGLSWSLWIPPNPNSMVKYNTDLYYNIQFNHFSSVNTSKKFNLFLQSWWDVKPTVATVSGFKSCLVGMCNPWDLIHNSMLTLQLLGGTRMWHWLSPLSLGERRQGRGWDPSCWMHRAPSPCSPGNQECFSTTFNILGWFSISNLIILGDSPFYPTQTF